MTGEEPVIPRPPLILGEKLSPRARRKARERWSREIEAFGDEWRWFFGRAFYVNGDDSLNYRGYVPAIAAGVPRQHRHPKDIESTGDW